jgi:hypothetical protein
MPVLCRTHESPIKATDNDGKEYTIRVHREGIDHAEYGTRIYTCNGFPAISIGKGRFRLASGVEVRER